MSHFIVKAETYSLAADSFSLGYWIVDAETEEKAAKAWSEKYNVECLESVTPIEEYADAEDGDFDLGFIDFAKGDA